MKFIENIVNNGFKDFDTGERVFYPNGAMGFGRLVESKDVEEKIKSLRTPIMKYLFFFFIPISVISYKLAIVATVPALVLFIKEYLFYKTLPVHNSKLGFKESAQRGAKTLPNWYFIMLGGCSISIIIMSIMLPILFNKSFNESGMLMLAMSSFGLLGLGLSLKMYQLKKETHE